MERVIPNALLIQASCRGTHLFSIDASRTRIFRGTEAAPTFILLLIMIQFRVDSWLKK